MNWYIGVLKKYAVFSGRARRKEYWMFVLINLLIGLALGIISMPLGLTSENGNSVLTTLYSLAVLLPNIAVAVRRLHDTDRSGWWFFISFIPLLGFIVMLVFMVTDSTPGDNRYGPNPKAAAASLPADI
jgi:uncharacterized membrane protein YhaH (DUF805 family)